VPTKNVVGRVVAVIWPVRRWSGEPIPETFDNPALDNQQAQPSNSATPGKGSPSPGSS